MHGPPDRALSSLYASATWHQHQVATQGQPAWPSLESVRMPTDLVEWDLVVLQLAERFLDLGLLLAQNVPDLQQRSGRKQCERLFRREALGR